MNGLTVKTFSAHNKGETIIVNLEGMIAGNYVLQAISKNRPIKNMPFVKL